MNGFYGNRKRASLHKPMYRHVLMLFLIFVAASCSDAPPTQQRATPASLRAPYAPPQASTADGATAVAYPPGPLPTQNGYPPLTSADSASLATAPTDTPTQDGPPPPPAYGTPLVFPTPPPVPTAVPCGLGTPPIPLEQPTPGRTRQPRLTFITEPTGSGLHTLWSINPDGTDARVVATLPADEISWAPDGTRLAFTDWNTLWLSDSTGAHACVLAGHDYGEGVPNYSEPAWSPTNNRIAVVKFTRHGGGAHVQLFDAIGGPIVALNDQFNIFPFNTWSPAWSPDGTRLAYIGTDRGTNYQVAVSDLTGTPTPHTLISGSGTHSGVSWSPDGKRIAFSYATNYGGRADIYVMNADGSHVRQLTHEPLFHWGVTWSPAGRLIAFIGTDEEQQTDVYVINADGTGMRQVTFDHRVRDVAWQP